MMDADNSRNLLPEGLADDIETETGAIVSAVKTRGGEGASREGAELTLTWPDGRSVRAYMNFDVNRAGAGTDDDFLREAAILRALSGPLKDSGVRAARFIAALPARRALLGEFISGRSDYNGLATEEERRVVAADFMAQLAKLHAIDISKHPVDGMGPVERPSEMARRRLTALRERTRANGDDPMIHLAIDWLEDNIPADPERTVIVHADAGPGNFLFEDNKVTCMLDWELVHYGDPMADLAMMSLRMLFQPFIPMPDAFRAYEAAGGVKVDVAKVRYWRLFFQTGFAGRMKFAEPDAPRPPNLGMNLVYNLMHRRVCSEALAEAAGIDLPPVVMPDAPPGQYDWSFEIALEDLKDVIVPRITDRQASVKAKGLARLVKWWRAHERFGPVWDAQEMLETEQALGRNFASLVEARDALRDAVLAKSIDRAVAVRLINARVTRDAAYHAESMGRLANNHFPELE